jgi:type VI secretion system protein ImpA
MAAADAPTPSVIDIEKLLAPVSGDDPAGEDLRRLTTANGKSILMDEIEERRRAIISGLNENLEQGEAADPAMLNQKRITEWREIERSIIGAFSKGKELSSAVTLVLATVSGRGWAALAPGFRFLRLLQEQYWDTLHPLPEMAENENPDYTDRLVAMERLDHENYLPLAIRQLGLTDPRAGQQFSWADFRQLEMLRSAKPGPNDDAEAHRAMVEEKTRAIEAAAERGNLDYYTRLLKSIDDGIAEINALREFINERYAAAPEDERPTFSKTEEAIDQARAIVSGYWKKKGGGAETEADAGSEASGEAAESSGGGGTMTLPGGDVVALLEKALAHLRVHQKHNPAAFLIEEAIRWTKMPISAWYLETINDPNMSGFVSKLMQSMQSGGSEGS